MNSFIYFLDNIIFVYFMWINSFYLLLLFLSLPSLISRFMEVQAENLERILQSDSVPGITIIAPAYNEEKTIVSSMKSMLHLSYRHIEIIVVNDGSSDNTLEVLKRNFNLFQVPPAIAVSIKTAAVRGYYKSNLYPNILIIDKENGGKADSLNAGINATSTQFFMAVDADTIIEKDALKRMIRPVLSKTNTIASGGTIRVVNNCVVERGQVVEVNYPKKFLPAVQVVEYLRAFLFGRLGWNLLGGNLVISGAFGLFNRDAVVSVGGYLADTVGEDMELTVRLHHEFRSRGEEYNIEFVPDPVAWTEVPDTWEILGKQRERWHRGLIDTLWRHKGMLFNPSYGKIGLIAYPFFVFGEMLAPIIEVIGYIGLIVGLITGVVDWRFSLQFFLAAWGLMIILTMLTILMEEATFKKYKKPEHLKDMFIHALVENLGYRQVSVFWRLKAFVNYFRGVKSWGKMKRTGFDNEDSVEDFDNSKMEQK